MVACKSGQAWNPKIHQVLQMLLQDCQCQQELVLLDVNGKLRSLPQNKIKLFGKEDGGGDRLIVGVSAGMCGETTVNKWWRGWRECTIEKVKTESFSDYSCYEVVT